jgi:diaminopimelate decarboxylase
MKTIFVNTANQTRQVKETAKVTVVGSFCDEGEVYKIVQAKRCYIAFCK